MSLIDDFCDWHFAYNHISQDRQVGTRRVLHEFDEWLGDTELLAATAGDFERFLALRLESLAPGTVKKIQFEIRPFFRWANRHDMYSDDAYRLLCSVPQPRGAGAHRPRPYSPEDLTRLFAALDKRYPYLTGEDARYVDRWMAGKSPWRRVWRHAERLQYEAIIGLALYGGMRRDEIMFRLELGDIAPEHDTLPARSSKNRHGVIVERAIPMIPSLRSRLEAWYEFRLAMNDAHDVEMSHDHVWTTLRGRYRGEPTPERQARGFVARLGWTPSKNHPNAVHWEFHRLRHTAATEMLRAGYKLHIVRKIMGHGSIAQTLAYAQLLDGDVLDEAVRVGARFGQRIDRLR